MEAISDSSNKINRILLCIITMAVLAMVVYVRVRLASVPLERDEGEYAYMGQLLLQGIPPYANAYTMKLPGTALIYALFMGIFGQTPTGIHLGFILVNVTCTTLVYLLARRLFDQETALIAGAFYGMLSLSGSVLGVFAHATHLVVLFSLAGILLLDRALHEQRNPMTFIAGFCLGSAVLMKQHAALMLPFCLLFQVWCFRKGRIKNSLILLIGAAIPYLAVSAWLYHAGVFGRFWFWTFQYARAYASGLSFLAGFGEFVQQGSAVVRHNLPIWLLAAAGIFGLCRDETSKHRKIFVFGYLAVSFIMVAQGLYFRLHYFVLMLPATAIFAGYASGRAGNLLPRRLGRLGPMLLLAVAAVSLTVTEGDYLFRLPPLEVSRKIYGTNPFPEAATIAEFLRNESKKTDRIAILGSEPEIYFLTGRLSATGHIYMYGLMENHPYAEEMQLQLIDEIESASPTFIIVVNNPASWLLRPDSVNKVLDWGDRYLSLGYEEVAIIDIPGYEPTRYLWGKDAAGYQPQSASFVSVFKRRW